VVKVAVAFHHRDVAATTGAFYKKENNQISNSMDVEKYIAVATENATLKAQIDRLEEKMDELLTEDEDVSFDPIIPSIIGFGYSGASKV
jgi:hypothetical protein